MVEGAVSEGWWPRLGRVISDCKRHVGHWREVEVVWNIRSADRRVVPNYPAMMSRLQGQVLGVVRAVAVSRRRWWWWLSERPERPDIWAAAEGC